MLLPQAATLPCALCLPAVASLALELSWRTGEDPQPAPPGQASAHAGEPSGTGTDPDAGNAALVGNLALLSSPDHPHWMATAPWGLIAIVATLCLVNGVGRTSGSFAGIGFTDTWQWASFAVSTVLATAVGAAVAFFAHKRRIAVAFDVALPVMAAGCIVAASVPAAGHLAFAGQILVASGTQVAVVLTWVILISNAATLGLPTMGSFALMCCAQYAGLFVGQLLGTLAVLPPGGVAYLSLFLMVLVALALAEMHSRLVVSRHAVEGEPAPSFPERVATLAAQRGLTPRETEVLSLWAAGHSGPHLQEELGISKNTLKTHLGHIYQKLGVTNREGLISLVERMP